MIYIKNTTETQTIFIPRNELQKEAYITSTKTYEDGYREGLEDGKEYQKDQLLNLYVTENGQYEREDGWGTVTVDMSIPDCSGAYDEGYNQGYEDGQNSVECPEGGCNLGEGEVVLDTTMAGFYELYAADDGYDGWSKFYVTLENGGAIKVHKAEELIQMFNEGWGIDFGAYYYVGGKITEIQEVNTQYGSATYVLDNGLKVYRGDWIDGNPFGEDQIKVGGYIVVYGIIQDYKGELQLKAHSQVIAYQECEGGEIVSCNLEDKGIRPSMGDRDANGVIVVEESEGFDGLSRVVIDPTTIYNEGVSAGKAEGSDLNIDAVSTPLGVGDWNRWTRSAAQFGLDAISEITIDGGDYQEWTKGRTLLEAYNTTDEIHIMENGEYRPVMGYDGFALRGYNVAWITDVIPTIDTDVEIWVKPYDGAPNMWQGFIGSQASDDDNTTFQIRKMDGSNAFCFRFGEQTFDYEFEYERWYRLRMNRRGVWVNGEQVCEWDVQAFEENPNPLMINGIYNLGFESENYRMNHAAYGYIYFHNSDSLLVPNRNGSFIGDKNRITQRQRTSDATLSGERNYYPNGYTKVTVDVPQNGGGSGDCNIQVNKTVELDGERLGIYPDEGYDGIFEVIVEAGRKAEEWREEGRYDVKNKLQTIEITENGRYSVDDSELVNYIEFDGNSYFDTNIPFGENTKIEVAITKTTYEEEEQFIGTANFDLFVAETYGGFGIVAGAGLAYGVFGRAKTENIPFSYEEEQILTLDRNGLNSSLYDTRGWIDESGLVDDIAYGHTIGIGKINSSGDGWIYRGLNGRIRYVKIWTDGNDDSTLVTFIPKNMAQGGFGLVNSDGIEYANISNLGEGTTTFISEWVRKYGEGWKEINVNVECVCPSVQDEALQYDTIAFSYTVDGWRNHNFIRENMTNDCGDHPLDCLLLRNRYGECTVMTKLDICSGSVRLEYGWNGGSIIYSLKSNTITKFSNSSINSYHLKSIDTGFAQLEENAIINCNALTDIKVTILNNDLSYQFATNCFNGLPTEGTITIDKNVGVTLTDDEITSFFRTIVGEGWTITIE